MDIDAATELQFEELKEQVRKMIVGPVDDLNQKLAFIDAVQRLGVSYHFEKEIDDELENIYHDMKSDDVEYDLYTTALRFRLLRQHGYRVSCGNLVLNFHTFKIIEP
ncbi:(+)-delta-cadinene synthase isozyme A-like [Hibiscus syriacus]|uniref:(+)-delta-cadinene synthase isozyme A-like n=1 Tax=Hibiscus syriacus TaxID=106335 RepID=UPI001920ECAF|nr:(+)-delta-cadinene synthase isozyme A-like [Hibiscus syriacus]